MHDAASYRRQAEALYESARSSADAMERRSYVLRAMECEARAVDVERGNVPPAYTVDPDPELDTI